MPQYETIVDFCHQFSDVPNKRGPAAPCDLCVVFSKRQLSPDSVWFNSFQTALLVPFGDSTFYDAFNQTDVTHKYSFDDNP